MLISADGLNIQKLYAPGRAKKIKAFAKGTSKTFMFPVRQCIPFTEAVSVNYIAVSVNEENLNLRYPQLPCANEIIGGDGEFFAYYHELL